MLYLFIGFSFFLSELIIIWICYELIYRKKNISGISFWNFIRKVLEYYLFMLKYRRSLKAQEMNDFLQQNSELRYELLEKSVFGVGSVIFLPIIVVLMSRYIIFPGAVGFFYVAGLGVLLRNLKEARIVLMYLLNESQKFLFKFSRKKEHLLEGNISERKEDKISEKYPGKRVFHVVVVLVTLTCGNVVLFLMIRDAYHMLINTMSGTVELKELAFCSPMFISLVFISLLLYCMLWFLNEDFRRKLKQKRSYKKHLRTNKETVIYMRQENSEVLRGWLDDILDICFLLRIKEVLIGIQDLEAKKVISAVSKMQMPEIAIGEEVFQKSQGQGPQMQYDIIKLLIAHELVHIHYNDAKWMKKVYGIHLLYIAIVFALILYGSRVQSAAVLWIIVFLILIWIIFFPFRNKRYWQQVNEFRADRIGLAVSNTSFVVLKEALLCTAEEYDVKEKKGRGLYKIYQYLVEQRVHPDVKRRILEAQREKKWGLSEYFRYLWMISRNFITGKGWQI